MNNENICPLCKNNAAICNHSTSEIDIWRVDCDICGRYFLEAIAFDDHLEKLEKDDKRLILYRYSLYEKVKRAKTELPITNAWLEQIDNNHTFPTISEQLDNVILGV